MDKKLFQELKTINTDNIAWTLAEKIRGTEDSADLQLRSYAIAYVLYRAETDSKVCLDNSESFFDTSTITDNIKKILNRYLPKEWDSVKALNKKYTDKELLAYLLFNNGAEDAKGLYCSTPEGISKLACTLLNVQEGNEVLDLCSGKGNFFIEAYSEQNGFNYTGVELNFNCNDIAQIRADLVQENITLNLCDALEYRKPNKADRIFANYPFAVKTPAMAEFKETIKNALDIPAEALHRASSDWVFNASIVEQLKNDGKAVAIMTNGATWNSTDKMIRQFFIENGYIETVISLPAKLFTGFNVAVTLIVFSFGNSEIKMIDASEIYTKERRINTLSDENIAEILSLLDVSGEKSIAKKITDFADDEFVLNATRYLEVLPEIKNGVELNTVAKSITRGAQIKADDLESLKSHKPTNYRFLALSNIADGVISFGEEQYLTEIPSNMNKFLVKNNSIILTRTGMPEFRSAVAQVSADTEILATGNFFIIELDEKKADPFYLQAFLASETGTALLKSICSGSNLLMISIDKLNKMVIPLPPIEEQKEIGCKYAAAMDETILLQRKLEKSIAKMKHIYNEGVE